MKFPAAVSRRAFQIFADFQQANGPSTDPIGDLAAAFYIASTLEGFNLTQQQVVEGFAVTAATIRRNYHYIRSVLKV